eukprot:CAMPEP_0115838992 /NCGR_PEP_ID=MMETSP0287-20121206/6024_1 /TAXON_ID=412157 /ORGANISM="Chrysochromulina rotalis, Strain UIO044" /LENGTH=100 /DNA_ID=CAMNT_0003292555 /DNA_START=441 /DNA_END=740 /DNA_ORIENTATION=+
MLAVALGVQPLKLRELQGHSRELFLERCAPALLACDVMLVAQHVGFNPLGQQLALRVRRLAEEEGHLTRNLRLPHLARVERSTPHPSRNVDSASTIHLPP